MHYKLELSSHDLAVAVGIKTDLIRPIPRAELLVRMAEIKRYLADHLQILGGPATCQRGTTALDLTKLPETVIARLQYRCPSAAKRLRVIYTVFFDIDPKHRAIGSIDVGTGPEQFLFEPGLNDIEVGFGQAPAARNPWQTAWRYGRLGFSHIIGGYDHLLFLLTLLLVSTRFTMLIKIVTAFTLAHAVTLSLAWFDLVALPSRAVEIVIAFSIVYVAAENLSGRRLAKRWLIAWVFGLAHGLGFFYALRAIAFPGSAAVVPLLSFNFGVEAGQVALLVFFYPLQRLIFSQPWYDRAMRLASLAILLLAIVWIIQRSVNP